MFQGDRTANALRCYCMILLLTLCDPQIDPKVLSYTISSRFVLGDSSPWKGTIPWNFDPVEIGLPGGHNEQ